MKKRSNVTQTLKLFWHFTKERKVSFWLGTIGAAIGIIIQDIVPPIIVANAFDRLQDNIGSNRPLELESFTPYLFAYAACMLLGMILWRAQVVFVWRYEVHTIQHQCQFYYL